MAPWLQHCDVMIMFADPQIENYGPMVYKPLTELHAQEYPCREEAVKTEKLMPNNDPFRPAFVLFLSCI